MKGMSITLEAALDGLKHTTRTGMKSPSAATAPESGKMPLVGTGSMVGLWRAHRKVGDKMLATMQERPIRPWHKLRVQRAMTEYRRTLDAIPMPAEEPNNVMSNDGANKTQ